MQSSYLYNSSLYSMNTFVSSSYASSYAQTSQGPARADVVTYGDALASAARAGQLTDVAAASLVAEYVGSGSDPGRFIDDFGAVLAGVERGNLFSPRAPLSPGFGQTGFRAQFQEPQFGAGNNQVRHFAAFVVAGYQLGVGPATGINAFRELTGGRTGTYPDFLLGQAGIELGRGIRGGEIPLHGVGAWIRANVGGP
jgi:hypothetical protein